MGPFPHCLDAKEELDLPESLARLSGMDCASPDRSPLRKKSPSGQVRGASHSQPVVALDGALHILPSSSAEIAGIGLAVRVVEVAKGPLDIPDTVARVFRSIERQHLVAGESLEQLGEVSQKSFLLPRLAIAFSFIAATSASDSIRIAPCGSTSASSG